MSSVSDPYFQTAPKQRYDAAVAKLNAKAVRHHELCVLYANRLKNRGFAASPEWVNDHFPYVDTWANRLLAMGHLIKRTGLKRMTRSQYAEWIRTMDIPKVVQLDTVRTTAQHIPAGTPNVGGYVSGTGVVPWTETEWAMFPHAKKFRIYQATGVAVDPHGYDIIDIEDKAATPQNAAQETKNRVEAGVEWTTWYATRANALATVNALKSLGEQYFIGHVNLQLADWNLNEEQAAALIGTFVEGITVVSVQWASPESNPNTIVPGGSLTLGQSNVDISVSDGNWIPSGPFSGVTSAPIPVTEYHGELVTDDGHGGVTAKPVSSTDDTHWQ
jgi:hypothetical protein